MISVAIVEDNAKDRQMLKDGLDYVTQKNGVSFSVVEFENPLQFLGRENAVYDIVFLDVEMPHMNGLELAKEIRKADKQSIIIFVTNLAKYAVHGYEVDALDFILKPCDNYSFMLKMQRALARISKTDGAVTVINAVDGRQIVMPIKRIKYLEVSGHYVSFHTIDGTYNQYTTLKAVENEVRAFAFAKCNRSCLINLNYVEQIVGDDVILTGNEVLAISRPQKRAFLCALSDHIGGRENV